MMQPKRYTAGKAGRDLNFEECDVTNWGAVVSEIHAFNAFDPTEKALCLAKEKP